MTIRIDTDLEGGTAVVRIAGRLSREGAEELMKHCSAIGTAFVLELSQLKAADEDGVAAIRSLMAGGASVRGDSPFIRMLICDD